MLTPEERQHIKDQLAADHTIADHEIEERKAFGKTLRYVKLPALERIGNEIFGNGGWGYTYPQPPTAFRNHDGRIEGWQATVLLVCYGFPPRAAVGWCDATYTSDGQDRLVAVERSIKGAATDACKKAWASWGNRFGRFLWDDEDFPTQHQPQGVPTPAQLPPPEGVRESDWEFITRAPMEHAGHFMTKWNEMRHGNAEPEAMDALFFYAGEMGWEITFDTQHKRPRFIKRGAQLPSAPNHDRTPPPQQQPQGKQCPNCECFIKPFRNGKVPDTCWHCSKGIDHNATDYCRCGNEKYARYRQCIQCDERQSG